MKNQNKKMSLLLKAMTIGFALFGLWVYFSLVPFMLETTIVEDVTGMMSNVEMTAYYRDYLTNAYYILIALFACTGIPCYIVLFLVWKMADTLEKGKAFVMDNAKRLQWISKLALVDIAITLVVLVVFWVVLDMYSELFYLMLIACLFAIPFSITTWALSHMVEKAAQLQLESDYTI